MVMIIFIHRIAIQTALKTNAGIVYFECALLLSHVLSAAELQPEEWLSNWSLFPSSLDARLTIPLTMILSPTTIKETLLNHGIKLITERQVPELVP
jgi:hypothetical protein